MIRVTTKFQSTSFCPPIGTPIKDESGNVIGHVIDVDMKRLEWTGEVEDSCRDILVNKDSYISVEIKEKEND